VYAYLNLLIVLLIFFSFVAPPVEDHIIGTPLWLDDFKFISRVVRRHFILILQRIGNYCKVQLYDIFALLYARKLWDTRWNFIYSLYDMILSSISIPIIKDSKKILICYDAFIRNFLPKRVLLKRYFSSHH